MNNLKIRVFLLSVIISFAFNQEASAALSGTYTINPSGTASLTVYLSLTSAISDLTSGTRSDGGTPNGAGVSGAVIFELATGYTSSGETFPLTFGAISGLSSTNTITVRPASGVSSALSISSSNTTATISLSGCTYLIFDGRPGGTGSNKYITIDNTSTSGTALRFINDASNNIIRYCTLSGVNNTAGSAVVFFSSASAGNGNDNNTIDYCDIRDGASTPNNGIISVGTTGKENSGNTISNSNIYNFFSADNVSVGIFLSTANTAWTITGNSFYQTATRNGTTGNIHRGMYISEGSGYVISSNFIGGSSASAGGSAWTITGTVGNRFVGMELAVGTASTTSVQGNTIANFSLTTSNSSNTAYGIWCAMAITSGNVNVGTSVGNTIGNSSTGSISVTSSVTGGAVNAINVSSSGVVNLSNNAIGSITTNGATTSISCSVNGILSTATGTLTISGNTIGHSSTANSINATTSSTSSTGQQVTGISHGTGAATLSITNNLIANLNNNYASTNSAGQVRGILSSAGVNTITGNTIRNLTTTSQNSSTGTSASAIGIVFTSTTTSGSQLVSQNTIHSLSNTSASNAVVVTGILATGPTSGTHVVGRNLVHSLNISSSNTASLLCGIQVNGGTGITYQNNIIRLGIDAAGNSITFGYAIYGLYHTNGTAINFYHNSVYIGGTGVSSSSNTAAFYRTHSTAAVNLVNNILANARSNSSGSAYNHAIRISNTTDYTFPYLVSNNNLLYALGTGGSIGMVSSTDYATLLLWQQTTNFDLASGVGDPNFVNATGNASAVDLHVSGTTPVEAVGNTGTGVTDDFDGSTRSGLTPADIGADAGNFTGSDNFTPLVSYTAFAPNTSSTSNRTLASVTITDAGTGVPTTGGNRPRIWYRRSAPSVSSWASASGTLVSGTANSGTWSFTIDYSALSITPTSGETYQYYVVVQDQATTPNMGYSPSAGASHTNVNTQSSAPTTPNSYVIVSSGLGTSINVGTGQTYTSLTGASGLFAAINASTLSGNTTVSITSDLSEDGTTALTNAGLDGYTLTIQPSAATTRVISNSSNLATAMIRLSGAAGVVIDGRSGGSGQYLRIVNTHTTPASCQTAIEMTGGCTNNTVRNCIIETNTTLTSLGNVTIGSGTNTGITIRNNDIRDAQGTPGTAGIPTNLIYSVTGSNVLTVQDNNVYNFTTYGIGLSSLGDGCTVSGNSVYYNASTTPSTAQVGILLGSGNSHTISGNYVGGQSANCGGSAWTNSGNITFSGIQLQVGVFTPASVQNNTIQNISLSGTGAVNFNGILVSSGLANIGTTTGNLVGHASTANSIYSTGTSGASGTSILIGISNASTSTTTINNNTVANLACSTSTSTTTVGVRGISHTGSGQCTISGNIIHTVSSNAATTGAQAAPVGILTNSANISQLISNNTIYNLSNTNTTAVTCVVHGIATNNTSGGGTISRNRIYGLTNTATGTTPQINGIFFSTGSLWTAANNQISVTNGGNTNSVIVCGIRDGSAGTNAYYYNSVYVGGSVSSGSVNSYGYLRTGSATVTLRNNLFYNVRSGGTGVYYAIGNTSGTPATNWSSTASNYNLLVVPTLSAAGEWGSATSQTLAQWQSSSGGDASSLVESTTNLSATNLFSTISTGNLNIQTGNVECWYVNGRGVQVSGQTEDYGSASAGRSTTVAAGGTDIGSDEFTPSVNPPDVIVSGSHTNSGTETFTYAGRTVATITWGASGTLPTFSSYKYWPGTTPNDITNNGTNFIAKYTNAYWVFNVTGGSGYSYNLTLYYDDALLGTVSSESALRMAKKETGVNGTWVPYTGSGTSLNTTANTMTVNNLTSFSEFAGTDNINPLPVEWLSFTGKSAGEYVELKWTTATEINNSHFVVERSTDARTFTYVGEVKGAGSSNLPLNYTFVDADAFGTATTLYYRLKQVDFDGAFEYSNVIAVSKINQNGNGVTIEAINPNPFTQDLKLQLNNVNEGDVTVEVFDLSGRKHYTSTQVSEQGTLTLDLSSLSTLAKGVYILNVRNGGSAIQQKLVKLQ